MTPPITDDIALKALRAFFPEIHGDNLPVLATDMKRALEVVFDEMVESIAALRAELLEQSRLNGMGAERELALMGRIERLENAAVKAVMPLEAMSIVGDLDGRYGKELAMGIREGIAAVREALHHHRPDTTKNPAVSEDSGGDGSGHPCKRG